VVPVPEPDFAGTVVVVVVVVEAEEVVVVLGGTVVVVVVPGGLSRLMPVGIVVVVVVEDVVVVVGATVVVVMPGVGVADGVGEGDAVEPVGAVGTPDGVGVGLVITAVVQAPAFCRVVTSATRRTSVRFSLVLSDVNVVTSCCKVFATPFR
jgi:hypothetical protein